LSDEDKNLDEATNEENKDYFEKVSNRDSLQESESMKQDDAKKTNEHSNIDSKHP
jgi:hypothetical protein